MSLVPIHSPLVTLDRVAIQQSEAEERLSLAFPRTDFF